MDEESDNSLDPGYWNMENFQKGEEHVYQEVDEEEPRQSELWQREFPFENYYNDQRVPKPISRKRVTSLKAKITLAIGEYREAATELAERSRGLPPEEVVTGSFQQLNDDIDAAILAFNKACTAFREDYRAYNRELTRRLDDVDQRRQNPGFFDTPDGLLSKYYRYNNEQTAIQRMWTSFKNYGARIISDLRAYQK